MGNFTSKPASLTPEQAAIKVLVDHIMLNRSTNLVMVPDIVERQIYMNLLTVGFGWVKETMDSIQLDILDHVITLHIKPKTPDLDDPISAASLGQGL